MSQEALQDFAYAFLSILFEGAPFILLGTILSGFIDVFLPARTMERLLPRSRSSAVLLSGLLGIIFPVCECAVVPVIRRLVHKGLPVSCALTYMLAAPIVNPVTALSTWKAFSGQDPVFMMSSRLILGYLIAVTVGLVLLRIPVNRILRPSIASGLAHRAPHSGHDHGPGNSAVHGSRLTAALRSALRDFVDVGVYFAIGITITALFNTGIAPGSDMVDQMATSTVGAPATLMFLAFLLSLCSTSDAFIAATLANFSYASRLAFLVFGPMMDVKLLFLYSTILRKRFIVILGIALFILTGAVSIYWENLLPGK